MGGLLMIHLPLPHQPFEGCELREPDGSSVPPLTGFLWNGGFGNFVFHELAPFLCEPVTAVPSSGEDLPRSACAVRGTGFLSFVLCLAPLSFL